jgi:hypothetical protein
VVEVLVSEIAATVVVLAVTVVQLLYVDVELYVNVDVQLVRLLAVLVEVDVIGSLLVATLVSTVD